MADSDSSEGGHAFGQRQPPLYVSIQKILDKYPDGQIFKVRQNGVLVQAMLAIARKLNVFLVRVLVPTTHSPLIIILCSRYKRLLRN